MALCREGALVRAPGRHPGGVRVAAVSAAANALTGSQRYPDRGSALRTSAWCEHSMNCRECFPSFAARLCDVSHISDPKRNFFPPKSRCGNFFQPFPFGHPRYIRSL